MDAKFRAGDIVENIYAGKGNPNKYLMYWRKGTVKQGRYMQKTYDCINYNKEKVRLLRSNEPLIFIGHMAEYDNFIAALKSLLDKKESNK